MWYRLPYIASVVLQSSHFTRTLRFRAQSASGYCWVKCVGGTATNMHNTSVTNTEVPDWPLALHRSSAPPSTRRLYHVLNLGHHMFLDHILNLNKHLNSRRRSHHGVNGHAGELQYPGVGQTLVWSEPLSPFGLTSGFWSHGMREQQAAAGSPLLARPPSQYSLPG